MKFSAAIAQNRPLGPLPILVPKQAQLVTMHTVGTYQTKDVHHREWIAGPGPGQ